MPTRFTDRSQKIVLMAQEIARRMGNDFVDPGHILIGVIELGEGTGAQVLANLHLDNKSICREIELSLGGGQKNEILGEIAFNSDAKRILEFAVEAAQQLGHHYVGTEHLLLGLVRMNHGVAHTVLEKVGVTWEKCIKGITELTGTDLKIIAFPEKYSETLPNFLHRFVTCQVLPPEVTGLLVTDVPSPKKFGWNVVIILLKDGTNLDDVQEEMRELFFKSMGELQDLPIEFKLPSRRPIKKVDGLWIENEAFSENLIY